MTTPGAESGVTIERLDGGQIELLEPLWRALIDHIRDLGSVVELVPHEQSWPRRRAIYEELLADGESFALGAWRGERLVGYAMVHVAPPDAVWSTGGPLRRAHLPLRGPRRARRRPGHGAARRGRGRPARARPRPVRDRRRHRQRRRAQRFYERRGFRDGFHLMHGWIGGGCAAHRPAARAGSGADGRRAAAGSRAGRRVPGRASRPPRRPCAATTDAARPTSA